MKTIKIIDLLNKIANGEEVPKRIYYEHIEYELSSCFKNYYSKYHNDNDDLLSTISGIELNDEVEILDEIEILDEENEFEDIEEITYKPRKVQNVINQLIKNQKKIIERLKDES